MEYKIISVENYLIASDDERKRGWFYCFRTNSFFHDEGVDINRCNSDIPVRAHLPLNGNDVVEDLGLLNLNDLSLS